MDSTEEKRHDAKCDDDFGYNNSFVFIIFLILILLLLGTMGSHS